MTVVTDRGDSSARRPAPSPAPRRMGGRAGRARLAPLLLVAPFALLLLATVLVPIGYALYLSLFTERLSGLGFSGPEDVFVWLSNYGAVLSDPAFAESVWNVARYALVHVPLMLGAALVLALLLDGAVVWLRQVWSLAVFLPYAVPGVIAGLVWAYLFSPGIGPLNDVLPWDPLGSEGVLPSIVTMATWQWMGYNMIIFYTALRTVPRDVLEAARIDGAGPVRTALSVKVPIIRPTIFVALVFTVIGSLQLFTEPLVLRSFTGSVTSTWTPSLYVYEAAFITNDYGRAAAASLLLALACAVLSALVMRLSTRRSG
ncbi:sugar ABC transporter permease [Actinoalloteichus sp. AHMU CJ021]|uniref:Multiple sugar transport system permease protein n=1 Tax=Actinoalloteichus caeruleus DSM 43889 TaxID=1120930 RepID=A0ABT1JIR3_ACTCY|nr:MULTISPECIES: sugar ABC transporter permease [Actinoalloteichus]AUS78157.1 sugar ABC transporter permease [Actinoalloteichus sp. AHMU CJ021]MCP2332177.1 multiple sugar transport system permease protein [Actinoalloteichus caeruleus DSM 43889]